LPLGTGKRLAEERQAFCGSLALLAIELQAVGAPVAQKRLADIVAGAGEELAARPGRALGKIEPVAAGLLKRAIAQPAQQHIVGPLILGVQLQPVPLEVLHSVVAPILAA